MSELKREKVKRYDIGEGLSAEIFEKAGFVKKAPTEEHKRGTYYFSKDISLDGIELQIEIDASHPFEFDDTDQESIVVFDRHFKRIFSAFYDEDRVYTYGNDIIKEYNKTMDSLVEKGIFVPKKEKKNKKLINEQ